MTNRFHALALAGLIWAVGLAVAPSAHAAVDVYMAISGISGESRAAGHTGAVDVLSCSYSFAQITGGGDMDDLALNVYASSASAPLLTALASGAHLATVTISFYKAGATAPFEFLRLTLTDVVVRSYSESFSEGNDQIVANIALAPNALTYRYTAQTATGGMGAVSTFTWTRP